MKRISEGMSKEDAILTPAQPHLGVVKHGAARRGQKFCREYRIWRIMVRRCKDVKLPKYADYGGRGISVCDRWLDYENFISDMGQCPSEKHSIHRHDNDKGYEKSNCSWADLFTQANNKRNSVHYTVRGFTGTLAELCRHFNCDYKRAHYLLTRDQNIDRAIKLTTESPVAEIPNEQQPPD
jgi:hypothetical protein